ncbi:MAG TPA: ATP-grasp domain-containing protein [Patescibacteria group bacterium]|nr:ATP-grasp domain-containing protein [Patescibacteria group bacterium]
MLGASARALAASAARSAPARRRFPAGLIALDYFGDADLDRPAEGRPPVDVLSISRDLAMPRSTAALGRAALSMEWSAAVCAGGLENRPGLLRLLARRGELLGSPARSIAAVRDPATLFAFLQRSGIAHASISRGALTPARGGRWLLKRRRSAGGGGVRAAPAGERRLPGEHFQRWIDGRAGSAAFVASEGGAVLLGVTEALGPDDLPGAPAFRYAGSILGPPGAFLGAAAMRDVGRAATLLTARFGLRGLNGFDFIAERGVPRIIEVNPRWTASMELYEERLGLNLFDLHLAACDGRMPATGERGDPDGARLTASALQEKRVPGYLAKGIVYATGPVTAPDPALLEALGARDRPRAGERFLPGQPICTLFASGADRDGCLGALRDRAAAARRLLLPVPDAPFDPAFAPGRSAADVVKFGRSIANPGRDR